jgi:hypothetical protein
MAFRLVNFFHSGGTIWKVTISDGLQSLQQLGRSGDQLGIALFIEQGSVNNCDRKIRGKFGVVVSG